MKPVLIIKVGDTYPDTKARLGDFEDWTIAGLRASPENVLVVDVYRGEKLPERGFSGAVVLGSHDMVTDRLEWSEALKPWIRNVVGNHRPLLGICYGHQLLADAFDGLVDFHRQGPEIGTVHVQLTRDGKEDVLFAGLPETFAAHVTHSQSVIELPDTAILLAENSYEPRHAFRIGNCVWGVQFHPEYSADVSREYLDHQTDKLKNLNRNPEKLRAEIRETPEASLVLKNFMQICGAT